VSKKRIALLVILELGGAGALLLGLWWDALLHAYAASLAEAENVFSLSNPDHAFLAQAVVAGIVSLGRFLLVFGIATVLVGLLSALYPVLRSSRRLGWIGSKSPQAFLVVAGILELITVGTAMWRTSAVSYANTLAQDPPEAGLALFGDIEPLALYIALEQAGGAYLCATKHVCKNCHRGVLRTKNKKHAPAPVLCGDSKGPRRRT
jgi:hypothetical protein